MDEPTTADLRAEIAALRATLETELKGIHARLKGLETTQATLTTVATQGRTGLRVLLWMGGLVGGILIIAAAFWRP